MAVVRQSVIDKDGTVLDNFPEWFGVKFIGILAEVNSLILVEESEAAPDDSGCLQTGQVTLNTGSLIPVAKL